MTRPSRKSKLAKGQKKTQEQTVAARSKQQSVNNFVVFVVGMFMFLCHGVVKYSKGNYLCQSIPMWSFPKFYLIPSP